MPLIGDFHINLSDFTYNYKRNFENTISAMFDLWKRIDELKLDKQICALMMVLVLVNPDRQCPESIRSELEQMSDIQEQFIEGNWSKKHSQT